MAIRRNPNFRFNYYMRSLPSDAIGRRCEQLMKAAEREIEAMEKKVREESGVAATADENAPLEPVKLPRFKEIRAMKRQEAEKVVAEERKQLENKVDQIESQMESIQKRLKELQQYAKESVQKSAPSRKKEKFTEVPEELLSELANLVAMSGNASKDNVSSKFVERYPGQMTKKIICAKIDEIARKEKRSEEGDTKMVWYVLPDYLNLLDVETIRKLRKAKEERLKKEEDRKSKSSSKKKHDDDANDDKAGGAPGPNGDMVAFPEYDASEPPRDHKKAFTLFCNATRREVKASLDPASRKDKVRSSGRQPLNNDFSFCNFIRLVFHLFIFTHYSPFYLTVFLSFWSQNKVNGILKERWFGLDAEEKAVWKKWQEWDERRYNYQVRLYERKHKKTKQKSKGSPKKRKASTADEGATNMELSTPPATPVKQAADSAVKSENTMSIPKKAKRPLDSSITSPTMSIPKKKRHF